MTSISRVNSFETLCLTKEEEEQLLQEIDDAENYYLEICREEGANFTNLTTFHGMIRIFSSRTWTSLIFWVLVVCTCLVFYMIFSGNILLNYAKLTTFQRVSSEYLPKWNSRFTLCGATRATSIVPDALNIRSTVGNCTEYTIQTRRNNFQVALLNITSTGAYLSIEDVQQLQIRSGYSHFLRMEPSEIIRQNNTKYRCISSWEEVDWIPNRPEEAYSMQGCENTVRVYLLTHIGLDPEDFPCFPPCREIKHKFSFSFMKNHYNRTQLFVETGFHRTNLEETRKMTMTDVLSLLGGGTSLFLGCSCVTLMETFVFLLKLVVQAISKDLEAPTEHRSHMTTTTAKTSEAVAEGQQDIDRKLSDNKPHDISKRRVSFHPDIKVRIGDSVVVVDESAATAEVHKTSTSHSFARQGSDPGKNTTLDKPSQKPTLGEKLFKSRTIHRQHAVDVADDIGDENSRISTAGFGLDDFNRAHPTRNILRRASTATSRASNTSRARSVKLVAPVTPRRRSQIFSKHLVMNDF